MKQLKKMISFLSAAALALSVVPSAWATEDIPTATYGHGTLVPVGTADGTGDADWNFAVDGKKFTLLDVQNSATSKYYVIADEDSFGLYKNTSEDGVYDPTDESNLGYWVNTKLTDGEDSGDWQDPELPEKIVSAIDKNHQWVIEATDNTAIKTEQRSVTAGVTVPAVWELVKYADRIRWNNYRTASNAYIWTRTTRSASAYYGIWTDGNDNLVKNNQFQVWGADNKKTYVVRPQFFLNENFFAKAAIDLENAGSEIIEIIEKIDYDTLSEIYSKGDIETYLPNVRIPSADGVTIATTDGKAATVGNTLRVTNSSAANGNVSYQWKVDGTVIAGATERECVLTFNEFGKKVTCDYTDDNGTKTSNEVKVTFNKYPTTITYSKHGDRLSLNGADARGNSAWDFETEDKSFTVLDVHNNDESKYYVIANEIHGLFTNPEGDAKYDPTREGNMGYYVNTRYIDGTDSGNWQNPELPDGIKNHIDADHVWMTEEAVSGKVDGATERFTVKAGVTVPAVWETQAYADRISWVKILEKYTDTYAWTRSPGVNNRYFGLWLNNANDINVLKDKQFYLGTVNNGENKPLRPQFFLDSKFFAEVPVTLSTAGSEIIKIIEENPYAVLKNIYSDDDIRTYLPNVDMANVDMFRIEMHITDGKSSTPLESIEGQSKLKVTVDITSSEKTNTDAVVVAAVYGADNEIIAMSADDVFVPAKGKGSAEIDLNNLSGITDECKLKAFLWNSMYYMEPLTAETEFAPITNYATRGELECKTKSQVFYPDDEIKFDVKTDGTFYYAIEDFYETVVADKRVVNTNGVNMTLDFAPDTDIGYYEIVLYTYENGVRKNLDRTSVAVVSDVSEITDTKDTSKFGINAHIFQGYWNNTIDLVGDEILKLGVKSVRDGYYWGRMSTEAGVINAPPTDFIKEIKKNGMSAYLNAGYQNKVYQDVDGGEIAPETDTAINAFADYILKLYETFDKEDADLVAMEVWNEYWGWYWDYDEYCAIESWDQYANLYNKTYARVIEKCPDAKLAIGFLGTLYREDYGRWDPKVMEQVPGNTVGVATIHSYASTGITGPIGDREKDNPEEKSSMPTNLPEFRAMLDSKGGENVEIWLTETGMASLPIDVDGNLIRADLNPATHTNRFCVSEQRAGQVIPRIVLIGLANGCTRVYPYQIIDHQYDIWTHESFFGMLRNEETVCGLRSPKPQYVTYAVMVRELDDVEFKSYEKQANDCYRYEFANDSGKKVTVLLSLKDGVSYDYETDTAIEVTDIVGNKRTLTPVDGKVTLTLDQNVQYISAE